MTREIERRDTERIETEVKSLWQRNPSRSRLRGQACFKGTKVMESDMMGTGMG